MLSKELVSAFSKPFILTLLSREQVYGYGIIKKISLLSHDKIKWRDGMLYPILKKLQREGLVESIWRHLENGRKRKYYKITEAGRNALLDSKMQWGMVNSIWGQLWEETPENPDDEMGGVETATESPAPVLSELENHLL
jgi:PadR family transcriptional regulator, regulatory protein PadR